MIKLKDILAEKYEIDLEVGDTILRGKFKNKKVVVKEFGVDDKGQPTINGKKMLSFRIQKLMPKKESVNEDYSQRARNFRVALRRRLASMKKGKKIKYSKLTWTALGNGNFKDSKGKTVPGQDIVQDLKRAVQSDIMQHRGAAGDDMVNAYLKFEGNKLTDLDEKYNIRKSSCKQSDGDSGSYRLSYTTKKGKKRSACHTSKKKAKGQIAAIEAPPR